MGCTYYSYLIYGWKLGDQNSPYVKNLIKHYEETTGEKVLDEIDHEVEDFLELVYNVYLLSNHNEFNPTYYISLTNPKICVDEEVVTLETSKIVKCMTESVKENSKKRLLGKHVKLLNESLAKIMMITEIN